MSKQFYSDGNFQTATLSAKHPATTVVIRLGPKAGVLIGTVRDAITGATLYPCLELRRPNGNFLSGSGLIKANFRVLLPSETEVTVKMWLDGYRPWYYPGTDENREVPHCASDRMNRKASKFSYNPAHRTPGLVVECPWALS
jgi:hypothetical protein